MRSLLFALVLLMPSVATAQSKLDPVLDPSCLPPEIKSILIELEVRFGKIKIISVQRRGELTSVLRVPSKHAQCKAIDFSIYPNEQMNLAAKWLMDQPFEVIVFNGIESYIHLAVGNYKSYRNVGPRATERNLRTRRFASYVQ